MEINKDNWKQIDLNVDSLWLIPERDQLSTLLAQREVVVKAYITFYKTGDVALVSGCLLYTSRCV